LVTPGPGDHCSSEAERGGNLDSSGSQVTTGELVASPRSVNTQHLMEHQPPKRYGWYDIDGKRSSEKAVNAATCGHSASITSPRNLAYPVGINGLRPDTVPSARRSLRSKRAPGERTPEGEIRSVARKRIRRAAHAEGALYLQSSGANEFDLS
jgi:hypothetical protein